MESDGGGGLEGALADPWQLVRDLEERVGALEEENEELRDEIGERLRKQQETIVAQDKQIGQLQNENEQLRRMLRDVQETAERNWRSGGSHDCPGRGAQRLELDDAAIEWQGSTLTVCGRVLRPCPTCVLGGDV